MLFEIFRTIENYGEWRQFWAYAFTFLLTQTDTPENAMDLRPITKLSRIDRQWSRYRAVAITKELAKSIPPTVAGGPCNMSAHLLSGHFQEILEDADNLQTLCGLAVDTVKCYNAIPRYPLALFMLKLGWPHAEEVVRKVAKFCQALRLRLSVPFQCLYPGLGRCLQRLPNN